MNKKCETCKYYRNSFWYDWCIKYEATCEHVIKYSENLECWKENSDEESTND